MRAAARGTRASREAVWGSGDGGNNRLVGNDLDNRLVGWGGNDTLTGGAGGDAFYLLEAAPFRTTITDLWPGAGSGDRLAFSRDPYASREEAFAAARQTGADVSILREGLFRVVVLQNTRLADLTLDDVLIV